MRHRLNRLTEDDSPAAILLRLSLICIVAFYCIGAFAQAPEEGQPPSSTAPAPQAPMPTVSETAPPMAPSGFYYFCQRLNAYYPTAPECPEGWVAIPVGAPPPPVPERRWHEYTFSDMEASVRARPNAVSLELFGRTNAFSLDYDRALTPHLTLGIGIASWDNSVRWAGYDSTVVAVPVYANYYFTEHPHRGYLTIGADWIHVSAAGFDNDTFDNTGFAGTVGGGYEYRDEAGFLFRVAGILIVGRSVIVNPSFAIGLAF